MYRRCTAIALVIAVLGLVAAPVSPARSPEPVAHAAAAALLAPAATFVIKGLATGVLSKVGGEAFGAVLSKLGFEDASAAGFKAVAQKIDELGQKVDALHQQVMLISAALSTARLSAVRHSASELIGRINSGRRQLLALADGSITAPALKTRKRAELLELIETKLKDEQGFLNGVIFSQQGNDDIIRMASLAEKTNGPRFWTSRNSNNVDAIIDFYQSAAAELLLLRVEFEYSSVTKDSTAQEVSEQKAIIKKMVDEQEVAFVVQQHHRHHSLPDGLAVDTHAFHGKHLVWYRVREGIYKATAHHFVGGAVRIPTIAEWQHLISGRQGVHPYLYLRLAGWPFEFYCHKAYWNTSSDPASKDVFWGNDIQGTLDQGFSRYVFGLYDGGHAIQGLGCLEPVRYLDEGERYWG